MMDRSELVRSVVRPFIAIFLVVIWGVLVVVLTLAGCDAMDVVPRELTVSALSYAGAYSYLRSREKVSTKGGGGER